MAPEGLYSYQEDPATDKYPPCADLSRQRKTISSMLGQLRTRTASLFMHPEDASARGLTHADASPRLQRPRRNPPPPSSVGDGNRAGERSALPKGLWRRAR